MTAWPAADKLAVDGRYLPATGAAAIAVCGFISLAWLQYRKRGLATQLVPMIFMSAAIYLRHRTVWMMMLAGMIVLLRLDSRLFRRLLPAALLAVAAVAVLAFYGSSVDGLAGTSQFSQSATNTQTWEWRLNGWKDLLLDDEQDVVTVSIGKSMGSGYWRIDPTSYQLIGVAPHNEYIQEYLRVGIFGTLFILLFGFRPFFTLWKMTKINPFAAYPSTSAWAVVVLVTLVYGVAYGIEPHAYALLGLANAIVLRLRSPEGNLVQDTNEDWEMTAMPIMAE
jgi:O-antigen ligase